MFNESNGKKWSIHICMMYSHLAR